MKEHKIKCISCDTIVTRSYAHKVARCYECKYQINRVRAIKKREQARLVRAEARNKILKRKRQLAIHKNLVKLFSKKERVALSDLPIALILRLNTSH